MAAEAINELDGPSEAAQYMRAVLERSISNADVVNQLMAQYTASKDAFFDGIVDQRALEFAGESLRKQDLIRWGIIDEKMAEAQQNCAICQQELKAVHTQTCPTNCTTRTMVRR